jgi:hypothetical protein
LVFPLADFAKDDILITKEGIIDGQSKVWKILDEA